MTQQEMFQYLAQYGENGRNLTEIALALGDRYYYNEKKYLGEILGRMVKRGTVIRLSRGRYAAVQKYKNELRIGKSKQAEIVKNQLTLFDYGKN